MRVRIKTLMIVVAIAAGVLWVMAHLRDLIREQEDYALGAILIEVIATAALIVIAVVVRTLVRVARRHERH